MYKSVECDLGGQPLVIETGRVAKQADGAAVVRYGDSMVLVTAVSTDEGREGIDFFPLTCDYQELYWAAGRIPGNYFRREVGRPSTKETLTSRMIDRPLRPRFPEGYKNETQVIANVLSCDVENDPDVLAMIGASAALSISDIPWQGPIAACRVGRVDGEFVINPTKTALEESDINVIVCATKDAIVMVEGECDFVSEKDMADALFAAQQACRPVIEAQEEMVREVGKPKREFIAPEPDKDLEAKVRQLADGPMQEAITIAEKMPRYAAVKKVKKQVIAELGEAYEGRKGEIKEIVSNLKAEKIRNLILDTKRRIDGRALDEVRPITCEVGILPRTHGSALFTRGETQALVTTTLGSTGDEQRIESIMGDQLKSFMLHYNFPPFSVGEAKRLGAPNRRETGHGNLAERAVKGLIPDKEDFFYTIRIVSDILESNGSSSMASVCGGSLSLMDAGVPIGTHVAGVAMGLIQEGDQVAILTDILGDEDHVGDMDFKVTGSDEGITAIQMDIKIPELSQEIMTQALDQARRGRLHIIDKMNAAIDRPRSTVSAWAPQVVTVQIRPEKIRDIIGPGGRVIKTIQAETGCRIDVEDDGKVMVSSSDGASIQQCVDIIKEITQEVEPGAIYEGPVKRITDFGAFVEVLPGTDGLLHISELDHYRVERVEDILHEGDIVKVKVLEVDPNGKIRLSRKALIDPPEGRSGSRDDRGGSRRGRR